MLIQKKHQNLIKSISHDAPLKKQAREPRKVPVSKPVSNLVLKQDIEPMTIDEQEQDQNPS